MFFIELILNFLGPIIRVADKEFTSWRKNGIDRQVVKAGFILSSLATIFILVDGNITGFVPNVFICVGAIASILSGILGAIIGKHWRRNKIAIWGMTLLFIIICMALYFGNLMIILTDS